MGGSPPKLYWNKVKGIAEDVRACWNLGPQAGADASPSDGPDGGPTGHDILGNWSAMDENAGSRPVAPSASPAPSLPAFVRGLDLVLFHRLLPPHLPPPGGILALRK